MEFYVLRLVVWLPNAVSKNLIREKSTSNPRKSNKVFQLTYSEFFLRLAIGFYMLIFQPPVNFCSDENIQTIFGRKLEDFSNYRIDYNSISQTVEKGVKKIFFSTPKGSKSGNRKVLVEPTMALLWRPPDVLLFRRPENIFFTTFSTVWDIEL
jgi:hypothetical protein